MDITKPWAEYTFTSFDLETTGQYPLQASICEMAAVKWKNGEIVDQFQTLIKPPQKMNDEVIAIHNITNEMVEEAPKISEKIHDFYNFIEGSIMMAHHAPFDLGFLAIEFEKFDIPLPEPKVLCTSLLSRKAIPESPNHRLVTLKKVLNLSDNQSHRALDDSISCLELGLICFDRIGRDKSLKEVYNYQNVSLEWKKYSMNDLCEKENFFNLINAIKDNRPVEMEYGGGSKPGKSREVKPIGIVRNPQGDYLMAFDDKSPDKAKRYYLRKVGAVKPTQHSY